MKDSVPARRLSLDRALLALTVGAFVVRALYLLLEPRCGLTGDENSWIALGVHELGRPRRGLSPLRNTFIFYPPVYPYFIAVLHRVFGGLAPILWVQAALGALIVPAVGRAGMRVFGRRAGLLAALFAAVYPDLVWFSVHFWSETLFILFLWWAFERTLQADSVRSLGAAAAAGVFFGLATLTRELSLYLTPFCALWLARPTGGGLRPDLAGTKRAAVLVLVTVLTVVPWTVRNALVFDAFIPVSTMGGLNLWQGNTTIPHTQIYEVLAKVGGPLEQDRYSRRMAWETIASRQPFWIFEKVGEQMPEFWKAGSEILDHLVGREACGPLSDRVRLPIEIFLVGVYLAVLGAFLVALVRVPPTAGAVLLLVLLAAYNLAHVVAYATTRFRLPVMPVLFIYVAALVAGEGGLRPLRGWRAIVLGGLVVATLLTLWPGLPELLLFQKVF